MKGFASQTITTPIQQPTAQSNARIQPQLIFILNSYPHTGTLLVLYFTCLGEISSGRITPTVAELRRNLFSTTPPLNIIIIFIIGIRADYMPCKTGSPSLRFAGAEAEERRARMRQRPVRPAVPARAVHYVGAQLDSGRVFLIPYSCPMNFRLD